MGNLPYYITSPIFRKFFVDPLIANGGVGGGAGGVFLIQHEVAEKIATQATKKSYLWWLLNVYYNVEYCFLVPARCFTPPPNVESAVVKLIKKDTHELTHEQFQRMIQFLDIVSPYKRKTLGKIMKIEQQAFATY